MQDPNASRGSFRNNDRLAGHCLKMFYSKQCKRNKYSVKKKGIYSENRHKGIDLVSSVLQLSLTALDLGRVADVKNRTPIEFK